jgi:serine/threonine protein kinase
VGQTLGEGAFGVVYACTNRATGEEVAVKMVDKVETPVEAIRKEAEMLKGLSHPNIVKFHAVFFERCFVCIVMDKYGGGDLVEGLHLHLKEKGKLTGKGVIHISLQMGSAIQFLHNKMIVHRDIKGDNFLLDRKNIADPATVAVLTDFGTATPIKPGEKLSAEVGTRIFWSPEFFNKAYGMKVDIWATGIIMYGLLDGRFPFKDEADIRKKEPRFPKRVPPLCEDYVRQMLQKDESKRPGADELMSHQWLVTKGEGGEPAEQSMDINSSGRKSVGAGESEEAINLRVDGANVNQNERRQELIDRMQEGGQRKDPKRKKPEHHYWAKWFTIIDKHAPGTTLKFEWWDQSKVTQERILVMEGVKKPPAKTGVLEERSPNVVGDMLREHNIDTSKFGVGTAKTLDQLAAEVQSGAARLMLDATEHKKLVRVVDVVLLRIYSRSSKDKVLIEVGEMYSDERRRNIARLPGTKKEPHENSKETAFRIVRTLLDLGAAVITFDFEGKEVFEEEGDSPSFPGVRTVYRKEIVEGFVDDSKTPGETMQKMGLPSGQEWSAKDPKGNTKFFAWMPQKEAEQKGVKLKSDGDESVSGLVMAPIGLNEEDLKKYLTNNNVDIALYGQNGTKTLKEFSHELMKGESSLVQDGGQVIRVVDVVVLQIVNPSAKDILVQTEQTLPDGTKNTFNRLPGAKRRPDENQFLTARRVLRKQLKIDENMVQLDAKDVQYFEEEKPSPGFPGLKTVYRKRLIKAELLRNDSKSN